MRTVISILGGISMLVVGFFALSEMSTNVQETALNGTNGTQDAFNATNGVFEGIGQAAGPGVVWMGIAAVILVFLGFLVYAGRSGR